MGVKQFDVIQQLIAIADGPNHDLVFTLFYMAQSFFSRANKSDNKGVRYIVIHTYYSVNMIVNGLLANHLHNRHYWQFAEQCMTQIALQTQINLP